MDALAVRPHEVPQAQAGHESGLAVAARDLEEPETEPPAAVIGAAPADEVPDDERLPRVELERPPRVLADERQPREEVDRVLDCLPV